MTLWRPFFFANGVRQTVVKHLRDGLEINFATIQGSGSIVKLAATIVCPSGSHPENDKNKPLDPLEDEKARGFSLFILKNGHNQGSEVDHANTIESVERSLFIFREAIR